MENTVNYFLEGLSPDMHPLTTTQKSLSDALNATMVTYNGNEMMLLNDMGNTLILDSTTGNIMGLNDGFVPVGMKEYGGILYIASYNPNTKEGELGTIPSPMITYTNDSTDSSINKIIADIAVDPSKEDPASKRCTPVLIRLSDKHFLVGDKFIIRLDLDYFRDSNAVNDVIRKVASGDLHYPIITEFIQNEDGEWVKNYGVYKLSLITQIDGKNSFELSNINETPQTYYDPQLAYHTSTHWFADPQANIDTEASEANDCYRTYPNILPGFLYLKIEPEVPTDIEFIVNKSTGINSPCVTII